MPFSIRPHRRFPIQNRIDRSAYLSQVALHNQVQSGGTMPMIRQFLKP